MKMFYSNLYKVVNGLLVILMVISTVLWQVPPRVQAQVDQPTPTETLPISSPADTAVSGKPASGVAPIETTIPNQPTSITISKDGKTSITYYNGIPTPEPDPRNPSQQTLPQVNALNLNAAPGYCTSSGGSTNFESITDTNLTRNSDGSMKLIVHVYIANPGGCQSGTPCPTYDISPEYVNAWIDWNGNQIWESSEMVMEKNLTGYIGINYQGTMTAITQFTPPSSAVNSTWMRVNLGWSYDPNDPCQDSWTWGNLVDSQMTMDVPKINTINVQGIGTPGNQPETGSNVRLNADILLPSAYEVVKCNWTGDLTEGEGDKDNQCQYEYKPATGAGPDVKTYGNKKVTLTIFYKDKTTGDTGTVSKDFNYKVFFKQMGNDDGDKNNVPNWFDYWGDDGAVPQLKQTNVKYDASLIESCAQHYEGIISLTSNCMTYSAYTISAIKDKCPAKSFTATSGIDTIVNTIEHENHHKWIRDSHNGEWKDKPDSDASNDTREWLPDFYETSTTHTLISDVDSCRLGEMYTNWKPYKFYGDNEYDCRVFAEGKIGDASKDWANPGKQTNPVSFPSLEKYLGSGEMETKSGPASPDIIYDNSSDPFIQFGNLSNSYSSQAIDSDGDGLYDSLKVSVGVNFIESSLWSVIAWLDQDGTGTPIAWASAGGNLSAGIQTIDLYFDGVLIRNAGLDGPYKIARVELKVGESAELTDAADDVLITDAYLAAEFKSDDIAFNMISDVGVDSNANDLNDLLRVGVNLDVTKAGTYQVTGELDGADNITVATSLVSLSTGTQPVNLDFDGQQIFRSRQNGPYHLRSLRVEDESGNLINFYSSPYNTNTYTYNQFENQESYINASNYSDQGRDINGDGKYDFMDLSIEIVAKQVGTYRVLADIKDSNENVITSASKDFDLQVGSNIVTLSFKGSDINKNNVDGPYHLSSITLFGADEVILDSQTNAYITQAYHYTDFVQPLVALTNHYQESVEDVDGNDLNEYLNISVETHPRDSGVIIAQGQLVDSLGQDIGWAESHMYMNAGIDQSITLKFFGKLIYDRGDDGPFKLNNLLVYHTGDPEQGITVPQAYMTSAYNHLLFESTIPSGQPPEQVTLISPSGNIDINPPTFHWNAVDNATLYSLSLDGGIPNEFPSVSVCMDTSCSATLTVPGGNHEWQVRAWNNNGYGQWSTPLSFSAPPPGCYGLTLTANPTAGGTPTASPANSSGCNAGQYVAGETITLNPGTKTGYTFSNWLDATVTNNILTMPASATTVTANYTAICYGLTKVASPTTGGTITASPAYSTGCATGKYKAGQVITFTATPKLYYHFDRWSRTLVNATTKKMTMPAANITIYGYFGANLRKGSYNDTYTIGIDHTSAWFPQTSALFYGGIQHYTRTKSSTVTLNFTGTRMAMYYTAGRTYGRVTIQIDTRTPVVLSEYALTTAYKKLWWSLALPNANHKVVITYYASNPTNTPVSFDGVIIQ